MFIFYADSLPNKITPINSRMINSIQIELFRSSGKTDFISQYTNHRKMKYRNVSFFQYRAALLTTSVNEAHGLHRTTGT